MTDPAFPDRPFDLAQRVVLTATRLAVVRHDGITIADLHPLFDAGYAALAALNAQGTITATGPAVAVYYGDPMTTFDLELGFPVTAAPDGEITVGSVTVRGSALPEGPAAASTYVGSYDALGSGWQALATAADAEPVGIWIESYVSDPTQTSPEQLRTDLIMPVRT
ncbi:GyrI-like domain-containing protein [Microbacterium telephonicum]|uniref:Effector-binding domain-containing protein n=1 Tax=Microbacterium telephonicum TaxID=1714841 RepID=A0A498CAF2_9MICO|nr:GyrI-like domain-containing protein [Microbacterium telephonicum]RLK49261.1 effector-binding domain-containing protein [Microbacterium telephonicum]